MASLQRLKRSWRVVYREGGRESPKQYVTTYAGRPIATKADAEVAMEAIEAHLAARVPVVPGTLIPLEELLQRWERSRLTGDRPNDAWSVEDALSRMRKHIRAQGWETVVDMTPAAIQAWRESTKGTQRVGSYLRALLWWGKDFAGQPVQDATLAALRPLRLKRKPPRKLLRLEVVAKAYAAAIKASPNLGAMIHCLAIYGWRPISAAQVSVGDVDGDVIRLKVKGGHISEHPLLPASLAVLRPFLRGRSRGEPLFFDPRTGKRWALHGSRSTWQWCRDHLGVSIYDLKRYAASNLLAVMPAHEGIQFTGHLHPGQLLTYPKSNEDSARASLAKLSGLVADGPVSGASTVRHRGPRKKTPEDRTGERPSKRAGNSR